VNGWQIGLIALFALNALVSVATVGKPRKPTTPGVAAFVLIFCAVAIFAVVKS
jgi:hypothetical protein